MHLQENCGHVLIWIVSMLSSKILICILIKYNLFLRFKQILCLTKKKLKELLKHQHDCVHYKKNKKNTRWCTVVPIVRRHKTYNPFWPKCSIFWLRVFFSTHLVKMAPLLQLKSLLYIFFLRNTTWHNMKPPPWNYIITWKTL